MAQRIVLSPPLPDSKEIPMSKLRLVYRTFEPFAEAFATQISEFNTVNPCITITAEPMDPLDMHSTMLKGGGLREGACDLMLTLTDWLHEAIETKAIESLEPWIAADPPRDWPDGWSPSMRQMQQDQAGNTYGIAYHDGPIMLMYRGDLFEDSGEQERFEAQHGRPLAPPATWREFLEIAKWFNRPEDGLAGASIAGFPDEHNNVYDFLLLLWSNGGELFTNDMRPAFNSAAGLAALEYYVDLVHRHQVVPLECLKHESIASGDYYAAGRSAMMWNWCGFSAVTELETSKIPGANRVALVPRGDNGDHATLNVYWVITMASGSKHKEQAWQFMRHLAEPTMDKVTTMAGGTGTRRSTWNDPEVIKKFSYYRLMEEAHKGARTLPALPCYPLVAHALSEMTRTALHEGRAAAEALVEAESEVAAILHSAGIGATP